VFVLHATGKLLARLKAPAIAATEVSDTLLGPWYATVVFWKPQVALFVNEATLFPVFLPLAPATTLTSRFPAALGQVLTVHGVHPDTVEEELAAMDTCQVAKTANRSTLGTMNDFIHLAQSRLHDEDVDLHQVQAWLAGTPCGPLYATHTFPVRALHARLGQRD
jgi:hypothetical protein